MSPQMSPRQMAGFALWFARWDLFERTARRTSGVVAINLMLTTAAAIVALALPWVVREVQERRLAENPSALAVWVSDRHPQLGRQFDPTLTAEFRNRVAANLPEGTPLLGVFGSYDIELRVELPSPDGVRRTDAARGRTLHPNEPLFRDRGLSLLECGGLFARPDQPGVIVSRRFLDDAGFPEGARPEALTFEHPRTGTPTVVPLVGVTRDPLPLEKGFVINERYWSALLAELPPGKLNSVSTGPIAERWPEGSVGLPPAIRDALRGWAVKLYPARTADGRPRWQLVLKDDTAGLTAAQWRARVLQLGRLMTEADLGSADGFAGIEPGRPIDEPTAAAPTTPPGYNRVGVYVGRLEGLRPTATAARESGLRLNESVIPQLEEIERSARRAMLALYGLLGLAVANSFANLYHLMRLRARQKAGEVGMLRAMGLGRGLLRWVAAAEALYLWALGTAGGVVAAVVLAGVLALGFGVTPDEAGAVVARGWLISLMVGFLFLTGLWSWFSTARAFGQLADHSPVTALAGSA